MRPSEGPLAYPVSSHSLRQCRRPAWSKAAVVNVPATQSAVPWAIALPSGSGLSRDPSDPCNPLLTYAQKPRTEAEEKSCSSHCRAKEAVR